MCVFAVWIRVIASYQHDFAVKILLYCVAAAHAHYVLPSNIIRYRRSREAGWGWRCTAVREMGTGREGPLHSQKQIKDPILSYRTIPLRYSSTMLVCKDTKCLSRACGVCTRARTQNINTRQLPGTQTIHTCNCCVVWYDTTKYFVLRIQLIYNKRGIESILHIPGPFCRVCRVRTDPDPSTDARCPAFLLLLLGPELSRYLQGISYHMIDEKIDRSIPSYIYTCTGKYSWE